MRGPMRHLERAKRRVKCRLRYRAGCPHTEHYHR